jgi:dTMP kinase
MWGRERTSGTSRALSGILPIEGAISTLPSVRGRFITLEGPEGSGKTVLGKRLAAALVARGQRVHLTREPGGTALGERVRSLLLERASGPGLAIDPRADALLFNAARAQLVAEVVRPALDAGETVICARFADSTLAYQGYGAGLSIKELRAIASVATGGLDPDLTILLDVDPELGLRRKSAEARNRFESSFDIDFHRRVRAGFLELARAEPDRWRVVDSTGRVDAVFEDVLAVALAGDAP